MNPTDSELWGHEYNKKSNILCFCLYFVKDNGQEA